MNNNTKLIVVVGAIATLHFPLNALAQNIIRTNAPVVLSQDDEVWRSADIAMSDWVNVGEAKNCKTWSPETSTIPLGQVFMQSANDCDQDQVRTLQPREQSSKTLEYRNAGEPTMESRTISASQSREAVGTREDWLSASPVYSQWVNEGSAYECQTWTPDPSTIVTGQTFTQHSDDCKIKQTRTRQDREQESSTQAYRNVGEPVAETQVVVASSSRTSVGAKESWQPTTALYGEWVNAGPSKDCATWTPDPSTITAGQSFTQTSTDCKQEQTRTRQDREQEITTLAYRNVGDVVTESQVIAATQTRQALGTKASKVCIFDISYNPGFDAYYAGGGYAFVWTGGYKTVPPLWFDANTGRGTWDSGVIPGLSRISNTEFKYNDGNKVWTITRGNSRAVIDGYTYYEVCYQ